MRALITACTVAACGYDASFRDCAVACSSSAPACPDGLHCAQAEGLCRTGETPAACSADAAAATCASSGPTVDLAVLMPATADAYVDANGAPSKANDDDDETRWTAASDGTPGHWWQVDLGARHSLASLATLWEMDGVDYLYYVSTSTDGASFATAIDETADTRTTRARTDAFPGGTCARYVRVTKTDTTGYWAILYTVNVLGR